MVATKEGAGVRRWQPVVAGDETAGDGVEVPTVQQKPETLTYPKPRENPNTLPDPVHTRDEKGEESRSGDGGGSRGCCR